MRNDHQTSDTLRFKLLEYLAWMALMRSTKVLDMTKPRMKPMQMTMALAVARTLPKRK